MPCNLYKKGELAGGVSVRLQLPLSVSRGKPGKEPAWIQLGSGVRGSD